MFARGQDLLNTLKVPERKSQTKYKEYLKRKEKLLRREESRTYGSVFNLSVWYWLFFLILITFYGLISSVSFWKLVLPKILGERKDATDL